MKRVLAIGLTVVISFGSLAQAEIWCGMTKHPGDVPLWLPGNVGTYRNGNQLYSDCKTGGSTEQICYGYIMGVADVLAGQGANTVCVPQEVTANQLVDVVKKYMTDHPEFRHLSGPSEVTEALAEAFGCKPATPAPAQ